MSYTAADLSTVSHRVGCLLPSSNAEQLRMTDELCSSGSYRRRSNGRKGAAQRAPDCAKSKEERPPARAVRERPYAPARASPAAAIAIAAGVRGSEINRIRPGANPARNLYQVRAAAP